MMLSLIKDPPPLGQVGVHARVLHEVVDEHIETAQVCGLGRHHFKNGLRERRNTGV